MVFKHILFNNFIKLKFYKNFAFNGLFNLFFFLICINYNSAFNFYFFKNLKFFFKKNFLIRFNLSKNFFLDLSFFDVEENFFWENNDSTFFKFIKLSDNFSKFFFDFSKNSPNYFLKRIVDLKKSTSFFKKNLDNSIFFLNIIDDFSQNYLNFFENFNFNFLKKDNNLNDNFKNNLFFNENLNFFNFYDDLKFSKKKNNFFEQAYNSIFDNFFYNSSFLEINNLNSVDDFFFTNKYDNNYFNNFYSSDFGDFDKIMDIGSKTFRIFYNNRKIFKDFFFLKKMRQKKITKIFSKITKVNYKNFINFFEYSLMNFLVKTKLVYSVKDSIFFIKNGFIFVNGVVSKDIFHNISVGDIVQVKFSKKILNFFKIGFDIFIRNSNNITHIAWKLNRFSENFYKQAYTKIPNWTDNLLYFYNDLCDNIEVDFSILASTILFKNFNINLYSVKYRHLINLQMLRNYNWKYII